MSSASKAERRQQHTTSVKPLICPRGPIFGRFTIFTDKASADARHVNTGKYRRCMTPPKTENERRSEKRTAQSTETAYHVLEALHMSAQSHLRVLDDLDVQSIGRHCVSRFWCAFSKFGSLPLSLPRAAALRTASVSKWRRAAKKKRPLIIRRRENGCKMPTCTNLLLFSRSGCGMSSCVAVCCFVPWLLPRRTDRDSGYRMYTVGAPRLTHWRFAPGCVSLRATSSRKLYQAAHVPCLTQCRNRSASR